LIASRPPGPGAPRLRIASTLVVVVALGLVSRLRPLGYHLWDKSLGDALYAVAVYLVVGLLRPRWPAVWLALAAFALTLAVECFQLTGVPARYGHVRPVRWVLGTTFSWADIAAYLVGIAAITAADARLLRRRRRPDE
jgi:hypothetical protein